MKNVEVIKANTTLVNRNFSKKIDRLRVAAYCRVSTDSEDQLNSYKSQVKHYTDYINQNPDWVFAGIYADEAITGTQTIKREDFQRMINDAMNGEIDMVVTKSISRFARNTLDTLKYVRLLKGKNVAVFFEEENINTLTMDGELLLVILSSVAQQEVENISANVKKGLKMKMQRGELVGFQGCLGYDYHPETKSISVNEKEAEIVRYIFRRYLEGMGCGIIARELGQLGYKSPRGSDKWCDTTVMGIIKNEKYKGDIRQGKTFTVDPISKRRLDNFGEEDQFYMSEHHEPIVSVEDYEAAQQIRMRRAANRFQPNGTREKYSKKYAFSSMLECGFCGSGYSRRSWHAGSNYHKIIWQCITAIRMGKKDCPHSKAIQETTLENAFLESYKLLCYNNEGVMEELLDRIESTLCNTDTSKEIARLDKQIDALEKKKEKLLDMHLEEVIDKETYEKKLSDVMAKLEKYNEEKYQFLHSNERSKAIRTRLNTFRKVIQEKQSIDEFDRAMFESIVDKVIVGGYDDEGNPDPHMLTFIYKTGFTNSVDSDKHKPERKNGRAKEFMNLPSFADKTREKLAEILPSFQSSDTEWLIYWNANALDFRPAYPQYQ